MKRYAIRPDSATFFAHFDNISSTMPDSETVKLTKAGRQQDPDLPAMQYWPPQTIVKTISTTAAKPPASPASASPSVKCAASCCSSSASVAGRRVIGGPESGKASCHAVRTSMPTQNRKAALKNAIGTKCITGSSYRLRHQFRSARNVPAAPRTQVRGKVGSAREPRRYRVLCLRGEA